MRQENQYSFECAAFGMMPRPPGRLGVPEQKSKCGKQICRKNVGSMRLDGFLVWEVKEGDE